MMYYIIRNNAPFGPYDINTIEQYVSTGRVLRCDKAYEEHNPNDIQTVAYYLKKENRKVRVKHKGSLKEQFKDIGTELIVPKSLLNKHHWQADKRLLILAIVGLVPLLIMPILNIIDSDWLTFYSISLYFSVIWGLFFYYLFKTNQVTLKKTLLIFFFTQIFIFLFFGLGINQYVNPIYFIGNEGGFISRLIFYCFAVGLTEELSKAIPLYVEMKRTKEPIIPQTLVFYGLISGIAFGVFEGVEYQLSVNSEMEYAQSFHMNIARLTSLPFLHALWCGIGAYFLAFAGLYPRYRISLILLSVVVPTLLHGIYDTFCGGLLMIPITIIAVVLLMVYLKQSANMQTKLRS